MNMTAKKRRYSSTAVGFPIRIDQKGDAQGVSGVFPSWMRAQRACPYVHGRENCASLTEIVLSTCQLTAYYSVEFAYYTPCGALILSVIAARQCQFTVLYTHSVVLILSLVFTQLVVYIVTNCTTYRVTERLFEYLDGVTVRLRYTYGSLGSYLQSFNAGSLFVHSTFNVRSKFNSAWLNLRRLLSSMVFIYWLVTYWIFVSYLLDIC